MNENESAGKSSLNLKNREELNIDGIIDVISFDESSVYLETNNGKLLIEGSELHISNLDVATGFITVKGHVVSITYNDRDGSKKAGLFRSSK